MIDYRVISIGTLAAHPLWDEKSSVRTGHATTTLICAGGANILVDPSLPPPILAARLTERTQIRPEAITHVFLTSLQPERRRALSLFDHAPWLALEREIQAARESVQQQLEEASEAAQRAEHDAGQGTSFRPPAAVSNNAASDGLPDPARLLMMLRAEQQVLARVQPADDALAPGVDLFPLPGVTVGTCGLLLALPGSTVLITGDAVPTLEHLQQGAVLPHCVDLQQARESFREAIEIADALILGRDGFVLNPMRTGSAGGIAAASVRSAGR